MVHKNESYEFTYRSPEKVYRAVAEHDIDLSIDRAAVSNETVQFRPKVSQTNLLPIETWPTSLPFLKFRRWIPTDGITSYAGDEVMAFFDKWPNNFLAGVVCIGNQYDGFIQYVRDREKKRCKLIQ
jgi:hypothetical protein